jgi:vacuolar-type H+-ATPase subunit I/STV1
MSYSRQTEIEKQKREIEEKLKIAKSKSKGFIYVLEGWIYVENLEELKLKQKITACHGRTPTRYDNLVTGYQIAV